MTAVKCLSNYDISFLSLKSHERGSHNVNVGQLGKSGKSKSEGGGNGASSHSQTSASSQTFNNKGKLKTLAYFLCHGPHQVAKCLQRTALNVLQAQFQRKTQADNQGIDKSFEGEEKSCARIRVVQFLEPQEQQDNKRWSRFPSLSGVYSCKELCGFKGTTSHRREGSE